MGGNSDQCLVVAIGQRILNHSTVCRDFFEFCFRLCTLKIIIVLLPKRGLMDGPFYTFKVSKKTRVC